MYVVSEGSDTLIIDPHPNKKFLDELKALKVKSVTMLLTHEHPDHTLGVNFYRQALSSESSVICHSACARAVADVRNNRALIIAMKIREQAEDESSAKKILSEFNKNAKPAPIYADIQFERDYAMKFAGHSIKFHHTPGHSKGSCCILLDSSYLFTGDSLLYDTDVITRFPGGSKSEYEERTLPYLKSLDKTIMVYPGHGRIFRLGSRL